MYQYCMFRMLVSTVLQQSWNWRAFSATKILEEHMGIGQWFPIYLSFRISFPFSLSTNNDHELIRYFLMLLWIISSVTISSQSMLIYHLNLKQLYLGNGCSNRKNNDIFDPRGVEESLIGQFWPYKAWWCKISPKMNFGLLFKKWYLGTQESFCKVSDQLDTRLNNYGLISRHTSGINCVNNCAFIFTRHQPRLFLKALLV